MQKLHRASTILNRGFAFVAGISLISMMLVTVGEMILRIFGHPMPGTIEIIGWLAAVTTAFALGYTHIHRGHISISLFTDRLDSGPRALLRVLVSLVSFALFVLITWHVFRHAGVLKETGSLSETMKVIVYPWVYMTSLGCAGMAFALFVNLFKDFRDLIFKGVPED